MAEAFREMDQHGTGEIRFGRMLDNFGVCAISAGVGSLLTLM